MRASTQHVQHRLINNNNETSSPRLPLGTAVVLAWVAGAIFMLSLAPYGYWIIAFISPAALYALLLGPMSNKRAFIIGEAYGMGLWCVGAFWLYTSIHEYGDIAMPLALLAIAVMGLGMGLFHAVMALIFNRFVGKQPLAFAALWVFQEWLKTWLFTGFPWLFVGYAFTEQYWLSSLAPVAGVFAVSFVAALLSASLVEVIRRRAGYLVITALFLALSIGLWLVNPAWTQPKANAENLKVSLIQGNIPQDLKWLTEYKYKTLEIYAQLSSTEWDQDLIIWPESSIPMLQTEAWPFINEVVKVAKETDTTWVTGIPYEDVEAYNEQNADQNLENNQGYAPFYNSVIALGTEGEGLYKKQNLVPFGEYIPFKGVLDLFPNLAGSQDIRDYSRGPANQSPLKVRGHNLGSAVCYEVAYPDTTRRNAYNTDFLLTISNDAWFGTSAGPLQHLQMVQMRSLETGRWFMRATNTGVTAIIDHEGKIVARAPQFERTVLRGEVQSRTGTTPYVKYGNTPILIIIGSLLLLSFLGSRSHKKLNNT